MTRADYLERMRTDAAWIPGWEAITEAFADVYGRTGEYILAPRVTGLSACLEGFGVYPSPNGYLHIVTRGLSCIRPHEDAFRGLRSGWGVELTMKWCGTDWRECSMPFMLLDRIAQMIEVRKCGYGKMRRLPLDFQKINDGFFATYVSNLALMPDTNIATIQTVHGTVEFLQLVNVSQNDVEELRIAPGRIAELAFRMKQTNPMLVFEQGEPTSYFVRA